MAPARPTNGLSGGTRAVVADAQRLADVIAQVLRLHAQAVVLGARAAEPIAIADRDVQRLVGAEQNLAAHVAAGFPSVGDEDLADVVRACRPSKRPRATASVVPRFAGFRVRKIDEPVRREARVQREPLELVAGRDTLGRPHGLGDERVVSDQAHAAVALGDEHRAIVGQQRDAPRMHEARRDGDDADLPALHVEDGSGVAG